ncbi:metalloregulator ArsR/SmtB family transcription factor [Paenibacillus sp. FSL K6-3182]|uniref:ArsR/SmtB family transcription factor n=1 Tax=Paenibacillus sp. FSL K6-3182 TaxID=2921495 RepID=UPI0030D38117
MNESNSFLDLNANTLESLSELFTAIAAPTRLKILYLLIQRQSTVFQMAYYLQMTPSAISHQLRELRRWELVSYFKRGKYHVYFCNSHNVEIILEKSIQLIKIKKH